MHGDRRCLSDAIGMRFRGVQQGDRGDDRHRHQGREDADQRGIVRELLTHERHHERFRKGPECDERCEQDERASVDRVVDQCVAILPTPGPGSVPRTVLPRVTPATSAAERRKVAALARRAPSAENVVANLPPTARPPILEPRW